MTEKTFQAHVVLIGSRIADEDVGKKLITIRNDYAFFEHQGQSMGGSVAGISPPDWEQRGVTPQERLPRRSAGDRSDR